jgi:hypothetical protein
MNLEAVLQFVRSADPEAWRIIVSEINTTQKRRNEQAARQFVVGNVVMFEPPDKQDRFKGRITAINRRGRVVLECIDGEHPGQQISVPAAMVARCA